MHGGGWCVEVYGISRVVVDVWHGFPALCSGYEHEL